MKLIPSITAMTLVILTLAGAAQAVHAGSAPAADGLALTFGYCRVGKGVVITFAYSSSQTYEFPNDTFRVAISNAPLIEAVYLDNPHFWYRNRLNTMFRYVRNEPQSGPTTVAINVKKKRVSVRIYNYANLFLADQNLPVTIQMGDSIVTYYLWFDAVGKPRRVHHKKDPVTPAG